MSVSGFGVDVRGAKSLDGHANESQMTMTRSMYFRHLGCQISLSVCIRIFWKCKNYLYNRKHKSASNTFQSVIAFMIQRADFPHWIGLWWSSLAPSCWLYHDISPLDRFMIIFSRSIVLIVSRYFPTGQVYDNRFSLHRADCITIFPHWTGLW